MAQFEPRRQLLADSLFFRAGRDSNITTEFSQAGVDAEEYSALESDSRIDNRAVHFELAHKMAEQLCGFEGGVDGLEFSRKTAVHLIAENTDPETANPAAGKVKIFQFPSDAGRFAHQSDIA